jgi:asparagine synthase (glutamine-hydrolysing)
VKVVLTGDGGDELFAGYDVHRRALTATTLRLPQSDFERAYVRAVSLFTDEQKRQLYLPDGASALEPDSAFRFAEAQFSRVRHFDRINQALALDVKLLLPGNNLVKPDKMAMAVSLEPRAPFLDLRMVELAFRIPGRLKLHEGTSKYILKRAAERLLPREIIYRDKQMFTVPIGEWFKGALHLFLKQGLTSRRFRDRGLFDPGCVDRMIDEHVSGRGNHTRRLRALIALELWQRMFLDASFDHPPAWSELGLAEPAPLNERTAA